MKTAQRRFLCLSFAAASTTILLMLCAASAPAQTPPAAPPAAAPEETATPVPTTKENLLAAFHEETDARTLHLAYAAKAEEEGLLKASSLLRAIAKSQEVHARAFAALLEHGGQKPQPLPLKPELKSTLDNIHESIKERSRLRDSLYPAYVKKAQEEKETAAASAFAYAQKAAAEQANLLISPLANPEQWKRSKKKFIICPKCGYLTTNLKLDKCPVSGDARKEFTEIE